MTVRHEPRQHSRPEVRSGICSLRKNVPAAVVFYPDDRACSGGRANSERLIANWAVYAAASRTLSTALPEHQKSVPLCCTQMVSLSPPQGPGRLSSHEIDTAATFAVL